MKHASWTGGCQTAAVRHEHRALIATWLGR